MSLWWDDNWTQRAAISVDAVGSKAGALDLTITVPTVFDDFWDNVASDGADVRIIDPNGNTQLTYQLQTWTYASKAATIEVDNYTIPAEGTPIVWLYWNYGSASDGQGSFTASTPVSGYVELGKPTSDRLIVCTREVPGNTNPRAEISKTAAEQLYVWWDVTPLLTQACKQINGRNLWEGVDYLQFQVLSGGADQSAMYDETETRLVECDGRLFAKTLVKAGTTATDYALSLTVGTTTATGDAQIYNPRAIVRVVTVTE